MILDDAEVTITRHPYLVGGAWCVFGANFVSHIFCLREFVACVSSTRRNESDSLS